MTFLFSFLIMIMTFLKSYSLICYFILVCWYFLYTQYISYTDAYFSLHCILFLCRYLRPFSNSQLVKILAFQSLVDESSLFKGLMKQFINTPCILFYVVLSHQTTISKVFFFLNTMIGQRVPHKIGWREYFCCILVFRHHIPTDLFSNSDSRGLFRHKFYSVFMNILNF